MADGTPRQVGRGLGAFLAALSLIVLLGGGAILLTHGDPVAGLLPATTGRVSPTNWWLTSEPAGRQLEVAVLTDGCSEVEPLRVREHGDRVRVEATVRHPAGSRWPTATGLGASCDPQPATLRLPVRLDTPLGERILTGCAPLDDRLHPTPAACSRVAPPLPPRGPATAG